MKKKKNYFYSENVIKLYFTMRYIYVNVMRESHLLPTE